MEPNKTFNSYEELQSAIDVYEKENCVQFWKRDAKTLKSAEHHSPNLFKISRPELRYYKLKYTCIHGGQEFRPKNKNVDKQFERNHKGTWKQGCGAHITVGLMADGKSLVVKSMSNEHNHTIPSLEAFKQLPKQRRLTKQDRKNVEIMMKLKVNKKLLQADLVKKSGNSVLLKDLSNIYTSSTQTSNNSLQEIIKTLTENYHCKVDVKTENRKFCGLFFQDTEMRKSFDLFPEMVFMDGTYKLLNIRCPVYVFVVENSFGTTDIVGIGILVSEDIESINWMLQQFKAGNPKWEDISVVMMDKCKIERHVISMQFPKASKLICLFHALQIFRREITSSKLNITSLEVKASLEYINKLAYAKSEENYNAIFEEMKTIIPEPALKYYMDNWHELRNEWVKGLTSKTGNFFNSTNNRLESLNAKLKSVISTYSTFDEFIQKLFILINIKRSEHQNQLSKMNFKVPYMIGTTKAEVTFYKHLTPFAFKKIEQNLKDVSTSISQYNFVEENENVICCTKKENKEAVTRVEVSELSCKCCFFTSIKLPCKHLLAYRKYLGLELFHEGLFARRWTRSYIEVTDIISKIPETQLAITHNKISNVDSRKPLTSHQKFSKSKAICLSLATLCSEVSTKEFYERLNILTELQNKWQNHEEVKFLEVPQPQEKINETNNNDLDIPAITSDVNQEEEYSNYNFDKSQTRDRSILEHDYFSSDLYLSQPPQEPDYREVVIEETVNNEIITFEETIISEKVLIEDTVINEETIFEETPMYEETIFEETPMYEETIFEETPMYEEVLTKEIGEEITIRETANTDREQFKDISMPNTIKNRGRPKGNNLTAIGLPRKRPIHKKRVLKKMKV